MNKNRSRKGINKTHGFTANHPHHRFYRCFSSAKRRCENKKIKEYKHYGGKGIKILWNSFEEFRDDMYERYLEHCKMFGEKNTTLDRVDNGENYCKENCKWATRKEQARNRSTNRVISFMGKTYPLSVWEENLGFPEGILRSRLFKGWSVEKCLTQQLRQGHR